MKENRPRALRRVGSSGASPGHEPTGAQDGTHGQADARLQREPAQAAWERHRDAHECVRRGYLRLVEAHADLARAYEVLAEVSENELAGFATSSVTAVVPTNSTTSEAPERPARAPDMLTTKDLVKLLRCDARTLRRKELAGEIPAPVRTGRLKRWRRTDIDRWIEERSTQTSKRTRSR